MNINQLRYFATIAQLNSFSKAATILGVNQPSLSKSINSLEEELGYKLFDRNGKSIVLNSAGERFLECVDKIYNELTLASDDINTMAGLEKSLIKVGVSGCEDSIIQCAANFKKKYPECEFLFDFSIDTLDYIDMKKYDIAIFPNENRYSNLGGYKLTTEKYVFATAKNNPISKKPIVSPKDLEDKDVIYLKTNDKPEYSYHICKALDIHYKSISFTNTRQSQLQLIAAGVAVGIIPEGIAPSVRKDVITLIPFLNKNFSREMMICFRKEQYLSPLATKFKEEIGNYFKLD